MTMHRSSLAPWIFLCWNRAMLVRMTQATNKCRRGGRLLTSDKILPNKGCFLQVIKILEGGVGPLEVAMVEVVMGICN